MEPFLKRRKVASEPEPKKVAVALPRHDPEKHTATCEVWHHVFTPAECKRYLERTWATEPLEVKLPFGKGTGKTHRKVQLYSLDHAKSVRYHYSGTDQPSVPPSVEILEVNERVCKTLGIPLMQNNGALVNVYVAENGDHISEHADDEADLASRKIVVVSLSESPWYFDIRHIESKEKLRVTLPPGSVLVMDGDMQEHWKHGVPQQKSFARGTRVSVTLRRFHPME